ncbi:MAG: DUF4363 family protein [Terrisporobacter sp.]|uniref:DUF4363 family protein n=1 Tax=Terrisporobacter sp. TaxID=1965305 RepID=UPI002FC9C274
MKTSWFVILGTVLFVFLGVFIHDKTDEFSCEYIDKFNELEICIKYDDWETASNSLEHLNNSLIEQKHIWYKLINHGYFNEIFMSIEILDQGIYLKNKMVSLQELEKIKMTLQNLEEDECCDFNRIF